MHFLTFFHRPTEWCRRSISSSPPKTVGQVLWLPELSVSPPAYIVSCTCGIALGAEVLGYGSPRIFKILCTTNCWPRPVVMMLSTDQKHGKDMKRSGWIYDRIDLKMLLVCIFKTEFEVVNTARLVDFVVSWWQSEGFTVGLLDGRRACNMQ